MSGSLKRRSNRRTHASQSSSVAVVTETEELGRGGRLRGGAAGELVAAAYAAESAHGPRLARGLSLADLAPDVARADQAQPLKLVNHRTQIELESSDPRDQSSRRGTSCHRQHAQCATCWLGEYTAALLDQLLDTQMQELRSIPVRLRCRQQRQL